MGTIHIHDDPEPGYFEFSVSPANLITKVRRILNDLDTRLSACFPEKGDNIYAKIPNYLMSRGEVLEALYQHDFSLTPPDDFTFEIDPKPNK